MDDSAKPNRTKGWPKARGGRASHKSSFQWRSSYSSNSAAANSKKQERSERFSSNPKALSSPANSASERIANVEDFGFVSKGDDRLKDLQNQELYHKYIGKKYLEFCGTSGGPDQLESDFAGLAITPINNPRSTTFPPRTTQSSAPSSTGVHGTSKNVIYNNSRNAELSSILLCMRKLREGITATRRTDRFAVEVYKQHIRAAILVQQMENYHSALIYLLNELHAATPLDGFDLQEFASYHMLHLAACLEDYNAALAVKNEFKIEDRRALQGLNAMIHGNYWSFRAARNRVDQYIGRLMDYADERMRKLALKCIGATYFTLDLTYLEAVTGMSWKRLKDEYSVGWELDRRTKTVTVRRPKLKENPQPQEHFKA